RAVVLGQSSEIGADDLLLPVGPTAWSASSDGLSYRQALDAAKADVIRRALASTHGNRAAAARLLGLHKTHLLNLMKAFRVE
ncbi:MAG TPA: helix-turn-helix domain-containing protein, partial [Candidatus Binatus sp.]|nr:helix-turn-helix domain-containing protein [Candidatus Binatus sp.]